MQITVEKEHILWAAYILGHIVWGIVIYLAVAHKAKQITKEECTKSNKKIEQLLNAKKKFDPEQTLGKCVDPVKEKPMFPWKSLVATMGITDTRGIKEELKRINRFIKNACAGMYSDYEWARGYVKFAGLDESEENINNVVSAGARHAKKYSLDSFPNIWNEFNLEKNNEEIDRDLDLFMAPNKPREIITSYIDLDMKPKHAAIPFYGEHINKEQNTDSTSSEMIKLEVLANIILEKNEKRIEYRKQLEKRTLNGESIKISDVWKNANWCYGSDYDNHKEMPVTVIYKLYELTKIIKLPLGHPLYEISLLENFDPRVQYPCSICGYPKSQFPEISGSNICLNCGNSEEPTFNKCFKCKKNSLKIVRKQNNQPLHVQCENCYDIPHSFTDMCERIMKNRTKTYYNMPPKYTISDNVADKWNTEKYFI